MPNPGTANARQLAPKLVGFAVLVVLSLPAATQPARADACDQIKAACVQAGFVYDGAGAGNGVIADCFQPIVQGVAPPANASRPLPQVDPQVVAACGDVEYVWNGNTYGWYDDGWNGPGWYIVGDELIVGVGFGGREGWHGWHHHGSHHHGHDHHGGHHDHHHDHHHHGDHHHGDHHHDHHHGGRHGHHDHHGGRHGHGHHGGHHGGGHHR